VQFNTKISIKLGIDVEVYLASPHQFFVEHQQQLLPNWNAPATLLILCLQRSPISLKAPTNEVAQAKDCLRARFIRWGFSLILSLQEQGYKSELFDPRTGYPLLAQLGELTLDDNAVVKALLDYPITAYQNCTLINHPIWGERVYPSTIVTSAPQDIIEPQLKILLES
jgi:Methylmalonic aciduria and homocystinuria type D protein